MRSEILWSTDKTSTPRLLQSSIWEFRTDITDSAFFDNSCSWTSFLSISFHMTRAAGLNSLWYTTFDELELSTELISTGTHFEIFVVSSSPSSSTTVSGSAGRSEEEWAWIGWGELALEGDGTESEDGSWGTLGFLCLCVEVFLGVFGLERVYKQRIKLKRNINTQINI